MKEQILQKIPTECPWRDTLYWYDSIDSTNNKAKDLARSGAVHGTVVVAGHQTAGRGRLGRSFSSDAGMGVYLTVILRPACKPEDLMHLTCAAGVAVCRAVKKAAGVLPQIKWINDLILDRKKLGGILTELSVDPATGLIDYAIVGIGINCTQKQADFAPPLDTIATSLKIATGEAVSPVLLTAALIEELSILDRQLFTQKSNLMEEYKRNCLTLGQEVVLIRADTAKNAKALDINEDGSLLVQYDDGTTQWIQSGEASIRGLAGYI